MFKVYVTDHDYPSFEYEEAVFYEEDCEFKALQCTSDEDIINFASDADALLVQYARITKKVMVNLKNLKVVVRYGVGVDTIELEQAKDLGITVCNVPDYGVEEVSTHTLALVLCCVRKIILLNDSVKSGEWDFTKAVPVTRTNELTMGFAAFGRIAGMASKKAAPFGFRMIACDPYIDRCVFSRHNVEHVNFERLLAESDIISCHLPLNRETAHMFNKEAFSRMKKGVAFINTSRGGVVDEKALIEAIENGTVSFAALDVCEKEPMADDNRLKTMPNVIITPHAAWYSKEAAVDLRTKAAMEVVRVMKGEAPLNPLT